MGIHGLLRQKAWYIIDNVSLWRVGIVLTAGVSNAVSDALVARRRERRKHKFDSLPFCCRE